MERLKIEYKSVSDLVPYIRSSRIHTDEHIAKIAASIRALGFNAPVAIDQDNIILCGHGRVLAALRLGMAEVPTVSLAHLTEAQKKAYILADNRLALDPKWDFDLVQLELADLECSGLDTITGFNPVGLGPTDEDD